MKPRSKPHFYWGSHTFIGGGNRKNQGPVAGDLRKGKSTVWLVCNGPEEIRLERWSGSTFWDFVGLHLS